VQNCPGTYDAGVATATDECQLPVTVSSTSNTVTLSTCGENQTVVHFATDICDLSSECTQTISFVNDGIAPVFENCPVAPVTLQCAGEFDPSSLNLTANDDSDCDNDIVYSDSGSVSVTCQENKTVTYTATDSCGNSNECEATVKVESPDPVCEVEDEEGDTVEEVMVATCTADWQESLPTPMITDVCDYEGTTVSNMDILNTLTCNRDDPVKSVFYSFNYTRTSEDCPGEVSCGYDVSIDCKEDTAFGFVEPVEGEIITYGNKEKKLDANWGWGSYYPSLPLGEFVYDMYAGASDEKVPPGVGVYVGSVTVNPAAGTYTVAQCSSVSVGSSDFHVEISKPSKDYGISPKTGKPKGAYQVGEDLFCKPLRPPGQFEIQEAGSLLDCVAGQPCCVAVHWGADYEASCVGANCTLVQAL
jgi:hypothetical protein